MFDIHVLLSDRPGSLARFGQTMGQAGVSLEGGGVFSVDATGHAHFLVQDGRLAQSAAEGAGLEVVAVRPVLIRRLKQDLPGQLGAIAAALAEVGVNIITQYSDHSNQLILVVDDFQKADEATRDWAT
jgi:hypothetical protein